MRTLKQVSFPENIVVNEFYITGSLSPSFPVFFPFEVETVFIFKVDVQSARMKMRVTVKNPARRDFSTLIPAYIIKTSKLSFHGMFPFFWKHY